MVIDNKIAKTEMVYEIKNEIPSYEEFMESYESDEKSVDSYRNEIDSYGDIGVEKGYGPCSNCGRSDHVFKLECSMYNWRDLGESDVFYSPEEALSGATDILLVQNNWKNEGWLGSWNFSSELRRKLANAIKDAVRIYRLGGSINGWLQIQETWTEFTTKSNYTCGTDFNGKSL